MTRSRLAISVAASFAFRGACAAAMVWLALWAEARPAPSLPDLVLSYVPYVKWVDRWNYFIWLAAYVPVGLALLWVDGARFIRYMVTSGLVSLARGVCIAVTGLGPVHGPDLHAGLDEATRWASFWRLVTPFGFFGTDGGATVWLTKDLFFSGHTATTFLLLLYVWRFSKLRVVMIALHLVVMVSIFLAHLHYTIDVIGAYAITFSIFVLREKKLQLQA